MDLWAAELVEVYPSLLDETLSGLNLFWFVPVSDGFVGC
jgi:hypothetical protein